VFSENAQRTQRRMKLKGLQIALCGKKINLNNLPPINVIEPTIISCGIFFIFMLFAKIFVI